MLQKSQQGLTLLEMLISLFIGIFLLGGVVAAYLAMRTTTNETLVIGELQNTGRLALNIMANDIAQAGFKGDISTFSASGMVQTQPAFAGDCVPVSGLNAGSFPQPAIPTNFVMLSAVRGNGGAAMGCINETVANSDVIQVKRVVGPALTAAQVPNAARYYLRANINQWGIFPGGGAAPAIPEASNWLYQHHTYYIQNQTIDGVNVPVLRRARLVNGATPIDHTDMVDGVERIRAYFGVDNNGDGQVNTYIPTNQMTTQTWLQETDTIVAVKLHVLVRALKPDQKYTNNNSYDLGDGVPFAPNDKFRRMAFSTTVYLYNAYQEEFQE
mgnify:FL=1